MLAKKIICYPFMTDNNGNECLCDYVQQELTNEQRELCYQLGFLMTDYYGNQKILWRKQKQQNLTLAYSGCGRGRSSVTFYWVSQDGVKYPMFLTDMDNMIKQDKAKNEVTAKFEFVKRGANYGVKLCE